jgi:hypothetical protein
MADILGRPAGPSAAIPKAPQLHPAERKIAGSSHVSNGHGVQ